MQYFGFSKQILVHTKKEMHTVVNCHMLCTVDPRKQFCTLYFVFLPANLVFNINDDNLYKKTRAICL